MQEIQLEDLPRHKHEYWVLEGMLPLGGGVIQRKVAIRPKLECDAIIRMELPDIFWAELAGWIAWHPKGTSSQPAQGARCCGRALFGLDRRLGIPYLLDQTKCLCPRLLSARTNQSASPRTLPGSVYSRPAYEAD